MSEQEELAQTLLQIELEHEMIPHVIAFHRRTAAGLLGSDWLLERDAREAWDEGNQMLYDPDENPYRTEQGGSSMTATETLAQYQALAHKATKGPWLAIRSGEDSWDIAGVAIDVADRDLDFLVASHALGPAMAAALQEILDLHAPFQWSYGFEEVTSCKECARVCADEEDAGYPCPTVSTITKHLEGK